MSSAIQQKPYDIWPRNEIPKMQKRSRYLRDLLKKLVEKGGTSSHSAFGTTLRYMIEGLEDARVPYRLTAEPTFGYLLEVDSPDKREWGTTREGPGTGPHDSGPGTKFPACKWCGGLKPGSGAEHQFIASAIGHQKGCRYAR